MDIRELDKKQLVLLTLLITFVVSIATGIVTVSLMNQMPKSVPQTINNVIQRTIEKVTTVQVPAAPETKDTVDSNIKENPISLLSNTDTIVSIYLNNKNTNDLTTTVPNINEVTNSNEPIAIGQGVIISDIGLILIDSDIINDQDLYKVVLDKTDFNVSILKKFNNGFTILKISAITDKPVENTPENTDTTNKPQ